MASTVGDFLLQRLAARGVGRIYGYPGDGINGIMYVQMATTPAQVRHLVDRAVRIARDQCTVTCIIFPNDVQDMEGVVAPPHEHGTVHTGIGYTGRMTVPRPAMAQRAKPKPMCLS